MFYPGETEKHTFVLPFAAEDVAEAVVSYKQCGRVVLAKEVTSFDTIDTESCQFNLELEQADTLKFLDNADITVQVNVKGSSGGRLTSGPMILECGEQTHRRQI